MSSQTLKVAVIGVGRLGRAHARWWSAIEHCELVGVYDTDTERASAVAEEFKTTAFASLDAALAAADALSIVTTTSAHFDVALQAIAAGKHLLIEKPIAATLEQGRDIVTKAKEAGVTLTVGHIERFNPAFLALEGLEIKPRFIEAHRLAAFNPRASDVAVILDLMVHDIDLALHLVGSKPERISASAVPVLTDLADIANVRIEFENGAVANLTASRISLQPMRKMRVFQRSGYYSLDFDKKRADIYNLSESGVNDKKAAVDMRIPLGESGREILYSKRSERAEEDMLKMELEAFAAAVRSEAPVVVTPEAALTALEVALEVEKVAQSGRLME